MVERFSESLLCQSIAIVDYILEDDGHTLKEAANEFSRSVSTIKRDFNIVTSAAFNGHYFLKYLEIDQEELKRKCCKARLILNKLASKNRSIARKERKASN